MKKIDIEKIRKVVPALSKSWAESRLEAAIFCLDHNDHLSGLSCGRGLTEKNAYQLWWETKITEKIKRTWNDVQDATEIGAEGMAALFVNELTPYQLILRSAKKTGIDYWLGNKNGGKLIFQNTARLEISGLINGSDSDFRTRIRQKKIQTDQSASCGLPAYVAITDFGQPRIAFEKV